MTGPSITARYLRRILVYDPNNGLFFYRTSGRRAGWLDSSGYRRITVAAKKYYEHRLAWLYCSGIHPVGEIDHINGDTTDNRIANLREATRQQNLANACVRKSNFLGAKGVTRARGKYRVRISRGGTTFHIGYFKSLEAAISAHDNAAEKLYGEFAYSWSRPSGRARQRAKCPAIARSSFDRRAA